MISPQPSGRELALAALEGRPTERVPVALFTWGFDYTWKVAGLEPWRLACGSRDDWRRAHLSLYERHRPDLILYEGAGSGPAGPQLLGESARAWHVRDGNTGAEYDLLKVSLALVNRETGGRACDPIGEIRSVADADRLIPTPMGVGQGYLDGLRELIAELGDRALVLPHCSPAYIIACYAMGFERAMEAMLAEPDLFIHVCDRLAAGDAALMRQLADAGAEAVFVADSWASCDVISPAMFERFALPYQRAVAEAAHAAGLRVILWNEGDVLPILTQEATLPLDAFAFEQPRKGVQITVARVREVFGPERCLFGNLDSELLFMCNDPVEIARAVSEQLRQSGPGAPFVLCTGSPLPSNIEPSAVDAMMAAARSDELRLGA